MFGNKSKSIIRLAVLAFFSVAVFAGCSANRQEAATADMQTPQPLPLRVGVTTDSPPFVFEKGGEIMGLEAELAMQLALYLGRPLEFVKVRWDRQIPALNGGETDIIMSGMTITPERRFRVAFTRPYLQSGLMAMVRQNDFERFRYFIENNPEDHQFFSIGVVQGTTGEQFARRTYSGVRIVSFTTGKKALRELVFGAVDMLIHDAPMIFAYKVLNEARGLAIVPVMLTREDLGWAVRRNDSELLLQTDAFLKEISSNGKLKTAVGRWFPEMAEVN